MKKIITLILVFSLVLSVGLGLVSCDRDYDENEVKTAAIPLIEKSK